MIGLAQVIAGAVLISFGLVNIGGALISEGISDMIYATMAGLSGNFSWKDWAIQKAISFSLSIMTAGIGRLSSVGNTIAKIGSVSRAAMMAKIVGKAATQFATTCLTNILTEKIMEQIQEGVIQKVVSTIEEKFLKGILNSMKNKVESLYASSKNEQEFEKAFSTMKTNIEGALGRNLLLPQQFDTIRVQLMSSLQSSYHVLTEVLKKSNSKYAKLASNAIQATFMINQLWNIVQSVLQFQHAYDAFIDIIEGAVENKNKNVNTGNINNTLVQARVEQLNSIIRGYISRELTKKLDCILRQIISGTLRQIGKAVAHTAKDMINSEFNGKNPVDIFKQSNQNKSQVSVEQPLDQQSAKQEREEKAKRDDLQNNIKNPKSSSENYAKEIKDKDRALGRADIKMLANSKARNIIVYNVNTGEKEVIRPSGIRRIPAFFKQSAKLNYKVGENEGIGHYCTARGTETYKQINGRKDCLIIAYYESLGRTVNESKIQQERDKLYEHIGRNRNDFVRYKEEIERNRRDAMIGGRQKSRPTSDEEGMSPIERDEKKTTASKSDGTYKTRNAEKNRLKQEENITITSQTHESEHVVPFRVASNNLNSESKIDRDSSEGRRMEGSGAAYYEQKDAHRKHPGTGSGSRATEYCHTLDYALRVEKNPSIAFQVATSEYASTPGFAENAQTPDGRAASNSYLHTLKKIDSISLRNPDGSTTIIEVLNIHREESLTARFTAENRRYPTPREQKIIRNKVRLRQSYNHSPKRQK
ncbi:unnamed protein product [Rotaria sordida]|uniref:Uncharacterized protein n=1 Tax=Rotaria sordida TaxID=392033 RepID=A0A819T2P5_9BILA|nr:unnamed protein product [Rotaria sordida]